MTEKSLTLYTSTFGEENYATFKMMPVHGDAPYLEAIYSQNPKYLVVIGKFKRKAFRMMDKMDSHGNPVLIPDVKKNISKFGNDKVKAIQAAEAFGLYPYVKERVDVETLPEYYITEPSEIEAFIKKFADNADTFNYTQYLEAPPIKPAQPEEASQQETAVETPEGLSLVKE